MFAGSRTRISGASARPLTAHPTALRPRVLSRLVYVRRFLESNIWRLESSAAGSPSSAPPDVATSSTRVDDYPLFSPDGHRIAFASARSRNMEIWTSDLDGSNGVQ